MKQVIIESNSKVIQLELLVRRVMKDKEFLEETHEIKNLPHAMIIKVKLITSPVLFLSRTRHKRS